MKKIKNFTLIGEKENSLSGFFFKKKHDIWLRLNSVRGHAQKQSLGWCTLRVAKNQ